MIPGDISAALSALVAACSPSAGWGWRMGAPANTECTSLAALALQAWKHADPLIEQSARRGLSWLAEKQREDGSWPIGEEVPESAWASSLACCALSEAGPGMRGLAVRGGYWLLGSRSRGLTIMQRISTALSRESQLADQDPQIPGWSWTTGTSAWVEPSSWALLALKQLRPSLPRRRTDERIEQGHALLADRMCRGGGWNYGTKALLGVDLPPYPDTTALALLALQDHPSRELTESSFARLQEMLRDNRSALVLALAVLAVQTHGGDVRAERAELRRRLPSLAEQVEVRTLALALLALDEQTLAFRVPRHA